jgi:sterol desaturase/sphingolipid hydroxylase (fatty acid hydroxylase superfamily)
MKSEQLIGLAIPVTFVVLLILESRLAAREFEPVPHWRRQGGLFFVMVLIVGSIAPWLQPLKWLGVKPLLDLSSLGSGAIPLGLLASTFFGYWLHRAEHRFDWLWRASHQLHHSAPRIDLSGAYFTHPIEVVLKVLLASTVNIYALGLSPMAASIVGLTSAVLSMWQHLNINTPYWLGFLVPRPEAHVLHHERDIHARNYGELPIWDIIFGTFLNPKNRWTGKVGFHPPASAQLRAMLWMQDAHHRR